MAALWQDDRYGDWPKRLFNVTLDFLDAQEVQKIKKTSNALREIKQNQAIRKNEPQPTIYGSFIYDSVDHIDDLNVSLLVKNHPVNAFTIHDTLIIQYHFHLKQAVKNLCVHLVFYRKEDGLNYGKISTLNGDLIKHIHSDQINCQVTIPDFNLNPGSYVLLMGILEGHRILYRNVVKEFVVKGNGNLAWGLVGFKYSYKIL